MSDAKTGLWSAFGALLGGALGATAGYYATQKRPRYARGGADPEEIEDAMVIGGATGAVVGSFVGGAVSGGTNKQLPGQ